MSIACISFKAQTVDYDTVTKQAFTNNVHVIGFCSTAKIERLEIASRTKTTSKLVGAKNTETSGDVEMVKALAEFMGNAIAMGAKTAVK